MWRNWLHNPIFKVGCKNKAASQRRKAVRRSRGKIHEINIYFGRLLQSWTMFKVMGARLRSGRETGQSEKEIFSL
jgi:hypothetical protein